MPAKTSKTTNKTGDKKAPSKSSASKKTPIPQKKTQASKTTPVKSTKRTSKTPAPAPKVFGSGRTVRALRKFFTLNRTLDIIGVASVLIGLLVLFSLLSTANSTFTSGVLSFFRKIFGGGVYVLPLVMIAGGLWLVLRNFERIPRLSFERGLGFGLQYWNLLAWLDWIYVAWLTPGADPFTLAAAGKAGGYLGAIAFAVLNRFLGIGGAAIALLAWLLIALALALDVTILELLRWIALPFKRLWDRLVRALATRRSSQPADEPLPGTRVSPYPELTPLPEDGSGEALPVAPFLIPSAAQYLPPTPQWVLPSLEEILESGIEVEYNDDADLKRARVIEETLASFGAPGRVIEINRGPTVTQFGVEPDYVENRSGRTRVRVGKIASLSNDLALALAARTIRVEAPVPGKGFVGIEVPNDEIATVALRDVLESEALKRIKSPLRFALGLNVSGNAVAADLSAMPHLLIAGQTGSGKSVCINAIICCLLMNNTPDDLRLIMVDPKRVELTGYNGIPHLLAPVVVELERVVSVLQWLIREMSLRYRKLAEVGARNIVDYNSRQTAPGSHKLPYLVVIVDELADLMMLAPEDTERSITRLAQQARATGIHLVIATQRPSVDVVTGLIKANFPSRIAFSVASGVDSRVVLDQPGAETLLGRGDMLFQAPDSPAPVRLQGVFVSDAEIQNLVSYWQSFTGLIQPAPTAAGGIVDAPVANIPLQQMSFWEENTPGKNDDPLLHEAIDLVRTQGRASISMLQRRLRIGYTRAARLIETMEDKGIVGLPDPSTGTREVLDYGPAAPPVDEQRD
jgi:S-DNA-T family DNA segregation ATPase FtsK/SpoIIIE